MAPMRSGTVREERNGAAVLEAAPMPVPGWLRMPPAGLVVMCHEGPALGLAQPSPDAMGLADA